MAGDRTAKERMVKTERPFLFMESKLAGEKKQWFFLLLMLSLKQLHFPLLPKTETILPRPVTQDKDMHSTCHYSEEQTDYSLPSSAAKSTSDPFLPALRRHHYLKVFRNQVLKLSTKFIFVTVLP